MSSLDTLLEANARFAEDFDKSDAQAPPIMPVAVVTSSMRGSIPSVSWDRTSATST